METRDTRESWDSLRKYVSKEQPGDHYMIHGNQTFYYQAWVNSVVPDFATIYILDTSGSMNNSDYTQAKYAITGEIYEYNCYALSMTDSKVYVYSAAYLSSMNVAESVFGTIPFGNASLSEIWAAVDPFIANVKHNSSSESLITNLYYTISDTVKRMFEAEGHTNPGAACALSAASFIMLTDESIFSSDTLNDVSKLSNASNQWYCPWFAAWQRNATNKFPTPSSIPTSEEKQRTFCREITDALKQMSYYYGVNFNWGLYGGLASSGDKTRIQDELYTSGANKGQVKNPGTAFWLNKVDTGKGKTDISAERIVYVNGEVAWRVPKSFHIEYPHEGMCRIALTIPSDYISGGDALKGNLQMTSDDKYNLTLVLAHFWRDSSTEYSAFRFMRRNYDTDGTFIDQPVTLPTIANMNLVDGSYHWETVGQATTVPTKSISCGGSYNVDFNDLKMGAARWTIQFKLVKDA